MKARKLHRWHVKPAEARRIQEELRGCVELQDRFATEAQNNRETGKSKNEKRKSEFNLRNSKLEIRKPESRNLSAERETRNSELEIRNSVRTVAGADVAFEFAGQGTSKGRATAGVIVYSFPEMEEIERAWAERPLTFPYVPGLLSFRELPALLAAFGKLSSEPDVIFCDAQGYAHPRRFGLACHLGVLLDRPTVGCAKSRLIGGHEEPGPNAGNWKPLIDEQQNHSNEECRPEGRRYKGRNEVIGAVVRTRTGVKPIYISQGHRVSLETAIELALAVCDGFRVPRPTREADHFVEKLKREGNRNANERR